MNQAIEFDTAEPGWAIARFIRVKLVLSMTISGTDLLEGPTIYKAYVSGLNFREYPNKIWPEIWY